MYIPILLIIVFGYGIYLLVRYLSRDSQELVDVVNLCQAVSSIVDDLDYKGFSRKDKIDYAILLQYLYDMQNLDIPHLNAKWTYIYNFFSERTKYSMGNAPAISYSKYGRISTNVIVIISLMYQANRSVIGAGIINNFNDNSDKFYKDYPNTIKKLEKTILDYDAKYTGHVMMPLR